MIFGIVLLGFSDGTFLEHLFGGNPAKHKQFDHLREKIKHAEECHKQCGNEHSCHEACPDPLHHVADKCAAKACHEHCGNDMWCHALCPMPQGKHFKIKKLFKAAKVA